MYKLCGFFNLVGCVYIYIFYTLYFADFKSDYCYLLIVCMPGSSNIIRNKTDFKNFHFTMLFPSQQNRYNQGLAEVIPGFRLEKGCIIARCHVPSVSIILKRSLTKFNGKYIASVNYILHAYIINQV